MSQQKLLIDIVTILDDLNIAYMLTGSTVSSLQGEPRSTHDIDIIVDIDKEGIDKLYNKLDKKKYYFDYENMLDALKNNSMFNIINIDEGDKIDFWLLTKDNFDVNRFSRRLKINIFKKDIYISSAEDTILIKLKWALDIGGSEKQFVDALRVYEVNYKNLDLNYINKWVNYLKIEKLWESLLSKANVL